VDEQEWLSCNKPEPMLKYLGLKTDVDKLHRFAIACTRFCRDLVQRKEGRWVIEAYQDYLETGRWWSELGAVLGLLRDLNDERSWMGPENRTPERRAEVAKHCMALRRVQADYLRCIFGNPFRPVALVLSCLTPTVYAWAEAIKTDRTFTELPILADALEDAGCTSEDILHHCRQPGEHVRSCWALDLGLCKC